MPSGTPSKIALTRDISPQIAHCQLTYAPRQVIDLQLGRFQHRRYEECLAELGCRIVRLPSLPDLPDSVFVEDTCLVLDELAVVTRPGAISRRTETGSVAAFLKNYRRLVSVESPGTLDGGDVLCLGRDVYIGQSTRTNGPAIDQMCVLLEPQGYRIHAVSLRNCLHLKSAACPVTTDTILLNPDFVEPRCFEKAKIISVAPEEPHAANVLLIDDTLVYPSSYPRTRARLESHGLRVNTIDLSELAKAEGGVTCCSVIFATL
jgi:dimethylargininase